MNRREFLTRSTFGVAALAVGTPLLSACHGLGTTVDFGALVASGVTNLWIPSGFSARKVATSGSEVAATGHTWHPNPDGGDTFATADGGWVYVSNAETSGGAGGVGAIRFDSDANIVDAYDICSGTERNCAGGASPWTTWISCEETTLGHAWECDPLGVAAAIDRPAMGCFFREAVAFHPGVDGVEPPRVYQTEDRPDGGFYRFTPDTWGDLSSGLLEVMTEPSPGTYVWQEVPDPDGNPTRCRYQVADTKTFNGGEGIYVTDNVIYFTTKGDDKVWMYAPHENALAEVYNSSSPTPRDLTGVDNVLAAQHNRVFVAEDGGNMEIVSLDISTGATYPVIRYDVGLSEITGPAFDPSGTRLYFSSQRNPGETFEVTGPWNV